MAPARNGKKNGKKPQPQPKRNAKMRSNAPRVQAQGVGVAPVAWGSQVGANLTVWDAKHLNHAPLPRAVAPYAVVRYTKRVKLGKTVGVIGSFVMPAKNTTAPGRWAAVCGVFGNTPGSAINATDNTYFLDIPMNDLGDSATLVPSAVSVQIMNPEALSTSAGIVYAGRIQTQLPLNGNANTWTSLGDHFVSFMNPRLLSAGKLVLKGVQIDSYPLNMSEVSAFKQVHFETSHSSTYDDTQPATSGWAPIIVYNPDGIELEYLITIEARVRFAIFNPAAATHKFQGVTSDATWSRMIATATKAGNAVRDIADVVANTGMAVKTARSAARISASALADVAPLMAVAAA